MVPPVNVQRATARAIAGSVAPPAPCRPGPTLSRVRKGGTRAVLVASVALLAACAGLETPGPRPLTADEGRALTARLLPANVNDRTGWAMDLYAAIAALELTPSVENLCSAIAITGQESGFVADPVVPGLATIARRELDRRREGAGIPKFALDAALALTSSNGKSYGERLDAVKTERQLSDLYEDFIGQVPFGRKLLADRNPVRTAGPMQVSIAFAQTFAAEVPYPYPYTDLRHEVFTRRGGLYFGVAHLLAYPASYDRPLYRFADYNAGHYASRNAAFQAAVTQLTGIPLAQDGDLLLLVDGRPAREPGSTELAARTLGKRLDLTPDDIRRDLARENSLDFERTALYVRVFALADRAGGAPAPRAVVPRIELHSPKITRPLTTAWFAARVDERYAACVRRAPAAGSAPPR